MRASTERVKMRELKEWGEGAFEPPFNGGRGANVIIPEEELRRVLGC